MSTMRIKEKEENKPYELGNRSALRSFNPYKRGHFRFDADYPIGWLRVQWLGIGLQFGVVCQLTEYDLFISTTDETQNLQR